jgi:AcrR family transcriptional regulator
MTMTDRETAILEAACRVIAREGADGLRMGAVAREAGVSSALIHYYFATRSELLQHAFEHADREADKAATEAIEGIPVALDRLVRLLVVYAAADRVFREDWILSVEMWRSAIFDDRLRQSVMESNRAWVGQVAGLIEHAAEDGSIPPVDDPELVALRLTALVDGLGLQILSGLIDNDRAADVIRSAIEQELSVNLAKETPV